jgi:hypothetical protein
MLDAAEAGEAEATAPLTAPLADPQAESINSAEAARSALTPSITYDRSDRLRLEDRSLRG